ncbi:hypothetical protein GE09DRAFT_1215111 [Coniochaeta sp. 2T2.1]|nr:hypothetical protein GE09DRAFT_1215111 [Coniochaeta sp. 2T2.1]
MLSNALLTLSLLAAANALTITSPKTNDAWDLSQTNTIEWTSVSTDPSNFSIVLVDNSNASGAKETVIKDLVETKENKYSFTNFVAAPGDKYQIRFRGTTAQNTGIVTQSENFNVTKSGVEQKTSTTGTGPTPTGSGAPVETTAPGSGNGAGALGVGMGLMGSVVAAVFMML